jgi:hypothetical protein
MEKAQQETEEEEEGERPKKKRREILKARNAKQQSKAPTGKAIRYHLYRTNEQKQLLQKWFGVARWTYKNVWLPFET